MTGSLWLLLCQKEIHPEPVWSQQYTYVGPYCECVSQIRKGQESAIFDCTKYSMEKKRKTSLKERIRVSQKDRKTSDCRNNSRLQTVFWILLHISGWLWIIEDQQSQAQLYSLQWNVWKHNSNVASCTNEWRERDAVYPISKCIDC